MREAKSSENLLSPPSLLPLGAPEPRGPPVILGCGSKLPCLALCPWCCCWHPPARPALGGKRCSCCSQLLISWCRNWPGLGPGRHPARAAGSGFSLPSSSPVVGLCRSLFWVPTAASPAQGGNPPKMSEPALTLPAPKMSPVLFCLL